MKHKLLLIFSICSFVTAAQTPCVNGYATVGGKSYPCNGLTLQSYISAATMGAAEAQDSWGWTDPQSGKEYAIVALDNGTAFVDISNPTNPKYLARLDTQVSSSLWRDVKVYKNYAFIVSDANGNHGMQIFDLKRLRTLTGNPAVNYTKTQSDGNLFWDGTGSSRKGSAHNIVINETTGFAYILGSQGFNNGGPIVVKLDSNDNGIPNDPTIVKLYSTLGYCHDAEVVIYDGPDPDYQGREIMVGAFSGNNKVNIIDFTNKNSPTLISSVTYADKFYTHQGWFTEDKRFFIAGDEVDEENRGFNTRTLVFNVEDLDNPTLVYTHYGATSAIDHNGYVRGNRFYLANYAAGLRVMRVDGLYNQSPTMAETNYFDCYPTNNNAAFNGTWNVYPFFDSGNLIVTGFGNENISGDGGLFVIKDPLYDNTDPVALCQDINATLTSTGSVTITANMLDGGSTDNMGIVKKTISKDTFTCNDLGPNLVDLTVEDDYGNKSTCTATVTVIAPTTQYIGGNWNNGSPHAGSNARISQNYDTATKGSIDACTCEIDANKTLTVAAENYLNITKDITVNGNLVVAHKGSVVQTDENATVANNGSINVNYTTPFMLPRVFLVLGSPMTLETRNGVFANSYMFLNHLTENFVPNPDVEAQFPLAENFADDNRDNWQLYSGTINPGEGYISRPQLNGNDGNKTYDMTFQQGTLNTGEVNFTVKYNGTRNGSPNVLANPYPSAIRAVDFINANAMVNEVYFWNPNTPPSTSLPGAYAMNFSMEDISMYNLSGGTPAPSDPNQIAPDGYISTAQGFGIKATAAGVATFNNSMRVVGNNNTAPRPSEDGIDRVWISVENTQYNMHNNTLIAFSPFATNTFDAGYDSRRLATVLSLYTHLEDGSEELGIQSRETFEDGAKVLLGFSSLLDENLEYTISVNDFQGASMENATIYLIDNQLNTITNLSEGNYTFKVGKGTYDRRFTLQFRSNDILGDEGAGLESISVYPNPTSTILNVVSPGANVNTLEVFDASGRILKSVDCTTRTEYELDLGGLQNAVYFVKISTDKGAVTKQIIKQ